MQKNVYGSVTINRILKFLVLAVLLLIGFLLLRIDQFSTTTNQTGKPTSPCVAAFADGGGPYYKPNSPMRKKIVPDNNEGEPLFVKGKVLLDDCESPAVNMTVDIWQANESGSYQDEWYRGRVKTDKNGNYEFETVIPKGYGEGTGYRPPHIHFKVFDKDREIITSQMFFPESKGTPGFEDAYLMKVETKESGNTRVHNAYHDIVLP